MAKKSIVELRRSDVQYKSTFNRNSKSSAMKQRKLFEFNIPTASTLPIGNRVRSSRIQARTTKDNPVVIDEGDELKDEEGMPLLPISISDEENDETGFVLADAECFNNSVFCPICNDDLTQFEIHLRESHCENCVLESMKTNISHSNNKSSNIEVLNIEENETHEIIEVQEGIVNTEKKEIKILEKRKKIKDCSQETEKTENQFPKPKIARVVKPKNPLPRFKIVQFDGGKIQIVVDGFNFRDDPNISKYFLSHFHSDHYIGLKKSWEQGTVYCSEITAKLMINKFKTDPSRIEVLELNKKYWIEPFLSVMTFDAYHCPGATIFLFQEWDKVNKDSIYPVRQVLHTGDFRSNDEMVKNINDMVGNIPIDEIYLDTTYLTPGYHFPLQNSVLRVTSQFTKDLEEKGKTLLFNDSQRSILNFVSIQKKYRYKFLFLVGTYSIGKEKLAIAIAEKLNTKIYVPLGSSRYNIVSQYLDYFPQGMITHKLKESCVHLVPLSILSSKESIEHYMSNFEKIYETTVGFIPTGWTFTNRWGVKLDSFPTIKSKVSHCQELLEDGIKYDDMNVDVILKQYKKHAKYQIFRIPYSEHSSFKDLIKFGVEVKWDKIVATVNLEEVIKVRDMNDWFKSWKTIRYGSDNNT